MRTVLPDFCYTGNLLLHICGRFGKIEEREIGLHE